MKKAEMEAHYAAYLSCETNIRVMLDHRHFPNVLSACLESLAHVVTAIKYRKQWGDGKDTADLLPFGVICRYAPALFEHEPLERLLDFVRSERGLGPNRGAFVEAATAAWEREEKARLLWNHLAHWPETAERTVHELIGIDRPSGTEIIEVWVDLGLVIRGQAAGGPVLRLASQLSDEMEGICPSCGAIGRGRRELFFKPSVCQRCGTQGYYHIKYANPRN